MAWLIDINKYILCIPDKSGQVVLHAGMDLIAW